MKKQLSLTGLVLVAVAGSWALLGGHGDSHAQAAGAGGALPEVTVARALLRPVSNSADFTGRVRAVDSVQVRPRVGGYVDSVAFKEGALVHKGDVLFRIDPRPFQAEVDRLAAIACLTSMQSRRRRPTDSTPRRRARAPRWPPPMPRWPPPSSTSASPRCARRSTAA